MKKLKSYSEFTGKVKGIAKFEAFETGLAVEVVEQTEAVNDQVDLEQHEKAQKV